MKKLFVTLMLVSSLFALKASSQTTYGGTGTVTTTHSHHEYYYYRNANVYYDPGSSVYWYYDEPVSKWESARTLPSNIIVGKTSRNVIVYDGDDPWQQNAIHLKKYKVKKNGNIKIKPERDVQ